MQAARCVIYDVFMTKKTTTPKTPEKVTPKRAVKTPARKPVNKRGQKTFLKQLVDFYWQILDDPELKPSDRIASAKRLESLLAENDGKDDKPQVTVILNIPQEVT